MVVCDGWLVKTSRLKVAMLQICLQDAADDGLWGPSEGCRRERYIDGSVSAHDEAADAQFIVYTAVPLR